ncbi:MAG: NADP-dependent oxidoreductase [Steroidobacteraceae bacterium]
MNTGSMRQFARRAGWMGALLGSAVACAAAVPTQMQAVRSDAASGTLKVQTVDVPTPKEGQVLLKVYAAGLNPSDWRTGGGGGPPGGGAGGPQGGGAGGAPGGAPGGGAPGAAPGGAGGPPGGGAGAGGPPGGGAGGPPGGGAPGGMMGGGARNPGNDAAGVVVAVGPGVTEYKVGDKVIAALQQIGGGAYAEYALALVKNMAPKPKNFTYEEAAGIPTAGFTGLRMVLVAKIAKGERVLVIGAAGGVGSTAVQVAKSEGATVISSASSRHAAYLKSIGVDEVISYDTEKVAEKARNIDVAIVTVGSENANAITYVKKGGRVVTIAGQADAAACAAAGVTCIGGGPSQSYSDGELMKQLVQLADAGKLKVKVDKVFTLAQVNDGYTLGRAGNREGKLVLSIDKDAAKK